MKFIQRWGIYLLPFIVGVLMYANTATYGFVYDDSFFHNHVEFQHLSSLLSAFKLPYNPADPGFGLYRPIPTVTFIVTMGIFGDNPLPLHFENIFIHGLICSLILLLLYRILNLNQVLSIGVAVLFAVLPIHTEVVANIKSRDELLSMLFFLVMWVLYERAHGRWRWLMMSSGCFLLALLSKEHAVIFPVIVGLVAWVRRNNQYKTIIISWLWFIPPLVIYILLRAYANQLSLEHQFQVLYIYNPLLYVSFPVRVLTALAMVAVYVQKILLPFGLSASYHFAHFLPINNPMQSWLWIAGLILIVSCVVVTMFRVMKKDGLCFGGILLLFSYLPMSQFFKAGGDVMAERWMYVPSLGLLMMVVFGTSYLFHHWKKWYVGVMMIIFGIYAGTTWYRTPVWASSKSLFTSMTVDAPDSVQGHKLLGIEYLYTDHNVELANVEFSRALKLYSDDSEIHNLLATAAMLQGKNEVARDHLTISSHLNPNLIETDQRWVQLYYQEQHYDQALTLSTKILSSDKFQWNDLFFYASTLAKLKRYEDSQRVLDQIPEEHKSFWTVQYLQAVILYKTGKKAEALAIEYNKSMTNDQRIHDLESF